MASLDLWTEAQYLNYTGFLQNLTWFIYVQIFLMLSPLSIYRFKPYKPLFPISLSTNIYFFTKDYQISIPEITKQYLMH